MPRFGVLWLALAAVALVGCTTHEPTPGEPTHSAAGGALLASVKATPFPDSVHFVLQVTNTSAAPVTLNFSSGQLFDFMVSRDGREVWRWSAERMFTQALRSERLDAGDTRTYTAAWRPSPRTPGEYVVAGVLMATNQRVRQETRFRIE